MSDHMTLTKTHSAGSAAQAGQWIDDRITSAEADGWRLSTVDLEAELAYGLGYASAVRVTYIATLVFTKRVEQ